MKRLLLFYFLLLLASLCISSCRMQKDISEQSEEALSSTETIQTDESTTSKMHLSNESTLFSTSNRLSREGLFWLEFDSLSSVDISPSGAIRATGYSAKISGSTSETSRDTTSKNTVASRILTNDSTGRGTSEQKSTKKTSSELKDRHVTRTPSLTPWIGAGIAIAIVILAVLWWLFGSKPSK